MTLLYFFLVLLLAAVLVLAVKVFQLKKGKHQAETEVAGTKIHQIPSPGAVRELTILPLVDFHAAIKKVSPGIVALSVDTRTAFIP